MKTKATETETEDASIRAVVAGAAPRPAIVAVWGREGPVCRALLLRVGAVTVIGRGKDAGFALEDEKLSRRHASVQATGDGFLVEDLGSRNGTFVNGARVVKSTRVEGDAVVRLGNTVLLLVGDGRRFALGTVRREGSRVIGPEGQEIGLAIEAAARAQRTLLIMGESGTGKEFAARDYHAASGLSKGPFVVVNSSAIPDTMAEALLFGAKRGAYTGAEREQIGYFERADGGVLFLDEVGLLNLGVQQKLLRAVETREIWPLGATSGKRVNVMICTATNEDLQAAIEAGRFRADLYQRLAQRVVTLPSLRSRPEEIAFFVQLAIERTPADGAPRRVTPEFVETCLRRRWPTNIRELTSAVEMAYEAARAVGEVLPLHLPPEGAARPPGAAASARPTATSSATGPMPSGRDLRKEAFREAFLRHKGHVPSAAAEVGVGLSTAYEYARELQGGVRS